MNECAPLGHVGLRCPRPAEVRVHVLDPFDGSTQSRARVCAIHAIQAATLAFVDTTTADAPRTVVLAPLGPL